MAAVMSARWASPSPSPQKRPHSAALHHSLPKGPLPDPRKAHPLFGQGMLRRPRSAHVMEARVLAASLSPPTAKQGACRPDAMGHIERLNQIKSAPASPVRRSGQHFAYTKEAERAHENVIAALEMADNAVASSKKLIKSSSGVNKIRAIEETAYHTRTVAARRIQSVWRMCMAGQDGAGAIFSS